MEYRELTIETHIEAQEALVPLLDKEGVEGCTIKERDERLVCTFYLPEALFSQSTWQRIQKQVQDLSRYGLQVSPLNFRSRSIHSREWEGLLEEAWQPRKLLPTLYALPPGYEGPGPEGARTFYLQEGMAFGTGHHATTRLALSCMERVFGPGDTVLEVGTGTGILALGAIAFGVDKVVAVDFDPQAVELARINVRLNGWEQKIRVQEGDLLEGIEERYSGIIINIFLTQVLLALPGLEHCTIPGARVVLSGILFQEVKAVKQALQKTPFSLQDIQVEGDWTGMVLKREE